MTNKEPEVFKDIIGYEGRYQISNYGNVKSFVKKFSGKLMIPKIDKDGYHEVGIRDADSKRKHMRVHRLVAMIFIPNPNNFLFVNHKDGVRDNNYYKNLEWCTQQYNNQHAFTDGNQDNACENHPQTKLTNEKVKEIYRTAITGNHTETQLAEMYNTTRSVVNKLRLKQRWAKVTDEVDKQSELI